MLSLNEQTLFYHNLAVSYRLTAANQKPSGIKGWAAGVQAHISGKGRLTKPSAALRQGRRMAVPTSTTSSVQSSTLPSAPPPTSKSSGSQGKDIHIHVGGIEDEDWEMEDDEREVAMSSPIKGRGQLTSSVSPQVSYCSAYQR